MQSSIVLSSRTKVTSRLVIYSVIPVVEGQLLLPVREDDGDVLDAVREPGREP